MNAYYRETNYGESDDITNIPFTFEDLDKDLDELENEFRREQQRLRTERENAQKQDDIKRKRAAEKAEKTTYERLKKKYG